ncbi:uncharacterized protein LOC130015402 [Mercurialis annua]|uniref:uncharacterized protein LOC130015402 n=1 Tax=Mercurialis annua TaxID=3986 RepID=UPI0024AEE287|nr:uncharacterized protein LOC130015402 [Mercurialis annua]
MEDAGIISEEEKRELSSLKEELLTAEKTRLLSLESDSPFTSFSEEEIFAAISSCGEKKDPGPDGFNFYFCKKACPFMKDMLMEFFQTFSDSISYLRVLIHLLWRLAQLMPKVVFENQHALFKERSIQGCSMIANEFVHSASRISMKFPAKWLKWMSCCFSSATTSMMVTGSPIDPINLQKGGFHTLTIKILSRCFNLTRIRRCFELISGLTINFHKSSIMGIHISEMDLLIAAELVSCKIDSFPVKYLVLSLARKRLSLGAWDHVVERVKSRLALWKGSLLSPAGSIAASNPVSVGIIYDAFSLEKRCIRRTCYIGLSVWSIFIATLNFKVGKGDSISLWYDSWMKDGPANVLFPRLFQLSNQKYVSINVIWNEGWCWRRRLRGSELSLLIYLQAAFNVLVPRMERLDEIVWHDKSANSRGEGLPNHQHNGDVRSPSAAARQEENHQLVSVMEEHGESFEGWRELSGDRSVAQVALAMDTGDSYAINGRVGVSWCLPNTFVEWAME